MEQTENTNICESIGERLKIARMSMNLQLKEMAQLLNYDRSTWGKIEKGLKPVPIEMLKKFHSVTGYSYAYLLGEDKEDGTEEDEVNCFAFKHGERIKLELEKIPKTHLLAYIEFFKKTKQ